MKAVIIDDEITSVETLQLELQRCCTDLQVIRTYTDSKRALAELPALDFDLLFLDIEMPWLNGLEFLKRLENIPFEVIFVTAYDQYAIQAFRLSAVDYLLKPIQNKELKEAIERVKQKINLRQQNVYIKNLLRNLNTPNHADQHLVLNTNDGVEFVKIKEIIRCEADSNYSKIITQNSQIFLAKTLKEIEQMLQGHGFFRIHSSHLVNISYILKYVKNDGTLVLQDGTELPVSRLRKDAFLDFVNGHHTT